MTEKRQDTVRFKFQFPSDDDAAEYDLAAVRADPRHDFTLLHRVTQGEMTSVLSTIPFSLGSTTRALAERLAELQAIVDKRDGCAWDSITELFHPDMNISDIERAVAYLLKVHALASRVCLGNCAADNDLQAALDVTDELLWVGRKTQLEKDEGENPPAKDIAYEDALLRGAHRGRTAEALWQLLDDIDTLSDQIKPTNIHAYTAFYNRSLDIAKKRHEHLKSDGYKLTWSDGNAAEALTTLVNKYNDLVGCVENLAQGYSFEPKFPEHQGHARLLGELFTQAHVALQTPVPMLLHCPMCHARHIDEGEFATKRHHTHACQAYVVVEGKRRRCGHVWRPAIDATVGVEALPGFVNP